ncbi:MAG: hypothetical protein AAF081_08635 [Actinomycetota bacterium]
MTADALLDLQALDVETRQLRHRRETLEQRSSLEEARAEQARQQVEIDTVAAARVEVATRQRKAEDEAQIVSDKADADEAKLYGGEVTGLKELEALQHEIATLRERQGGFEDAALEAMMEAEELQGRVEALEGERASIDGVIAGLDAEISAAEVEIDGQLNEIADKRVAVVATIDADLAAEYERRKPAYGASTVVRFDGSNCAGCPSSMPAMEVDRFKHLDGTEPADCQECGRIVLR